MRLKEKYRFTICLLLIASCAVILGTPKAKAELKGSTREVLEKVNFSNKSIDTLMKARSHKNYFNPLVGEYVNGVNSGNQPVVYEPDAYKWNMKTRAHEYDLRMQVPELPPGYVYPTIMTPPIMLPDNPWPVAAMPAAYHTVYDTFETYPGTNISKLLDKSARKGYYRQEDLRSYECRNNILYSNMIPPKSDKRANHIYHPTLAVVPSTVYCPSPIVQPCPSPSYPCPLPVQGYPAPPAYGRYPGTPVYGYRPIHRVSAVYPGYYAVPANKKASRRPNSF